MMIYLDNAATSAKKPAGVILSLLRESVFTSVNAGRGAHRKSIRAMKGISRAAERVAELFGADDSSRVAFLPNATYALNFAMLGVLSPGDHIIVTSMDHNSVLRPAAKWGNFTVVDADSDGIVNPENIEKAILPETALIVCTHVSNVCGAIQPVEKIAELAHKYGILFMLDASQSAGCMEIDVKKIKADIIAFSGHKGLLGPLGTGGIWADDGILFRPIVTGGTGSLSESLIHPAFMPDVFQSGTLNTPAIIALGKAIGLLDNPNDTFERERALAKAFEADLKNMTDIVLYGTDTLSRNGTVSFNIRGVAPAELEEFLDCEKGIIVRSGFHCAPLAHKTLGSEKSGSVRVSFGYYSTEKHQRAISDAVYSFLKQRK